MDREKRESRELWVVISLSSLNSQVLMSYLDPARKAKDEYRRNQRAATHESAIVDQIVDESVVAVLIDSTILEP